MSKSFLLSKTFWLNALMFAGMVYPPIGTFLAANPDITVEAFAVANIILRFVSKDQIKVIG